MVVGEKPITADMTVDEVVTRYPRTVRTFFKYGLHCVGCHISAYDSIADGARSHSVCVETLLDELNRAIEPPEGE
ncbi:MAG: DUF1858 domain-containing protein [Chloroflexi bacterium]|nr:DUF1858 domain-containing protein [Chloroflexota bacterium]